MFSKFHEKTIIAGDFNGHHSNWSSKVNARGIQLFDTCLDTNFVALNSGEPTRVKLVNGTLQESSPDITFVSSDVAILFKWSVTKENLGSDHSFIKFQLEYSDVPCFTRRRNYKLADWQLYHDTCQKSFSDNNVILNEGDIQSMYNFFIEKLNYAADQSIPFLKINMNPSQSFKPKPYWCPTISHAIAKRRLALKQFRKNPTPNNLNILKKCIAEAQKCIRQAVSNSWKKFCGEINETTSSSEMWQKMRWIKGIRKNRVRAPDDKKEQLLRSLAPDFVDPPPPRFTSQNSQLESMFTPQEIYNCLKKKDTAPGEDCITYSMIYHLPIEGKLFLLKMYNLIFIYAIIPEQWRQIKIIPIPKINTDSNSITKFRPISLISCICKIFHTMLNKRLEWFIERNKILGQTTSGFRRSQSSVDCIARLVLQIQVGFAKNIPTLACFLDIDSAYNNVLVDQLVLMLDELKVGSRVCNYLFGFLKLRCLQIKEDGEETTFMRWTGKGLAQGDPISPLLFNIITSKICKLIDNVYTLQYADDFVFYVQNKNIQNCVLDIQDSISLVYVLLGQIGLDISFSKTHLCLFSRGRRQDQINVTINENVITVVDCVRYLGVWMDRSLRWNRHISEIHAKSTKLINVLKILAGASWGVHPKHLRRVYISLIRSRIDYSSFIYDNAAKTNLLKLDRVQNAALRVVGGFIKTTPIHVMECELCLPPLYLRRKYLATRYCLKSQSLTNNLTIGTLKMLTNSNLTYFTRHKKPLLAIVYNDTKTERMNTSNPLHMFKLNTWVSNINMDFVQVKIDDIILPKNRYDHKVLKFNTLHMLGNKYNGWHKIYTDGSQTKDGRGAAFYDPSRNVREGFKCVNDSNHSIMFVELFAISEALSHVISAGLKKVVILSDSKSALQHIARCTSGHRGASIAYTILGKVLALMAGGATLGLQWVPSHVGIRGNEEADILARQAISSGTEVHLKLEYSEVLNKYKTWITGEWKEYFDVVSREKGIWYRTMQSEPPHIPWCADVKLSRNLIVIAHRLRSGHVPLNKFKFLMKKVESPNCELCGVPEDVYHFLMECVRSAPMREEVFRDFNLNQLDVGLFQGILAVQTSDAAKRLYRSTYLVFKEL